MEPSAGGSLAALKLSRIRLAVVSISFFTYARAALAVVIAFQVYQLTHSVLALGWLGFAEALPAIAIAPFGGYVADHFNRQKILKVTRVVAVVCSLLLLSLSWGAQPASVVWLYVVIFINGIARGFADPATTGFEAQVVPRELTVNAAAWFGAAWIASAIVGPATIGFVFQFYGAFGSYLLIALCYLAASLFFWFIPVMPQIFPERFENVFQGIRVGWRALFNIQPLFASMILDLFSVFFGGAIILLPVYANDILKVGAGGLGLLNAAPSLGALLMTLVSAGRSPIKRAGRNLIWAVAGFGVSIVIFAFSRVFWLSLLMLFLSGAFDGVSMVIRRSMMRLLSPDHLRGRIAAAGSIFIVASNELGAFESGMVAALIGTVPCVALGGLVTLLVVGVTTVYAGELRGLRL